MGDIGPAAEIAAALVGGSLAGVTHSTKAGCRVLINTSPEPLTNWTASIMEDIAVFAGIWAAIQHPTFFVVGMVIFIIFMIWALPKLWRGIKRVFKFFGKLFGWSSDDDSFSKPLASDKLTGPD
jgi:hypothetical protein